MQNFSESFIKIQFKVQYNQDNMHAHSIPKKRSPHHLYCRILYPLLKKLYVLSVHSGVFYWNGEKLTFSNCPQLLKLLIEEQINSQKLLKILFIDNLVHTNFKAKQNKKNTSLNDFIKGLKDYKIFNLVFFQEGNRQLQRERLFMRELFKLFIPYLGTLVRVAIFQDKRLNIIGPVAQKYLNQITGDQKLNQKKYIGSFTKFNLQEYLKPIFESVDGRKFDYANKILREEQQIQLWLDFCSDDVKFSSFQSSRLEKINKFYEIGPTAKYESKYMKDKSSIQKCKYIQPSKKRKEKSLQQNTQILAHIVQLINRIANNIGDKVIVREDKKLTTTRFPTRLIKQQIRLSKLVLPVEEIQNQDQSDLSASRGRQFNLNQSNSKMKQQKSEQKEKQQQECNQKQKQDQEYKKWNIPSPILRGDCFQDNVFNQNSKWYLDQQFDWLKE